MKPLTAKQHWILYFLEDKSLQVDPAAWWTPTTIGREYGRMKKKPWMDHTAVSTQLKSLAAEGLIEHDHITNMYRWKS